MGMVLEQGGGGKLLSGLIRKETEYEETFFTLPREDRVRIVLQYNSKTTYRVS
jgi:hypothetical protein